MKFVSRITRPLPELLKHSRSYNDITLADACRFLCNQEIISGRALTKFKPKGCGKLYGTFMHGIIQIRPQSLIYLKFTSALNKKVKLSLGTVS